VQQPALLVEFDDGLGAEAASWYVGWFEPSGRKKCKSYGAGECGKRAAEKGRRKIEAQLMTGTYHSQSSRTWEQFRQEYDTKVLAQVRPETRRLTLNAMDHFAPARQAGEGVLPRDAGR
jgi:hypothetical protein